MNGLKTEKQKDDEVIFNLFIIHWWFNSYYMDINEEDYKRIMFEPWFFRVRRAFPEEYCSSVQAGVNYLKCVLSTNGKMNL